MIKVLSAQPWANTPKILVNVVRALVRSRLSYGLEAMPHLSKTGIARLTAIEVRGLRLALGFNNLTHSYSLPAVSVFTAELLAISMALQHISAIPVTPFAIVICSDSKAALTAIKSDSQNAREDLVREIATTTHQLITRGTEVRFQWVPAHVCLSGNEKADRAAKRGAKGVDSSTVTMKIGLADVYAELTKQAWKQWEKEFHPMATAKEWDDTSSPCRAGVFFPGIPTYLARIMHVCTWASGDACAYRRSVSVG